MLKLSDFDYYLPRELIAQYPLRQRDNCRLMVVDRKRGTIEHRSFRDIVNYLNRDDLLVLNDTKVLPCRIFGRRVSGAKVEVFLLGRKDGARYKALIKPTRVKVGDEIIFDSGTIKAKVSARNEIIFNVQDEARIYGLGRMPLPPYIKREAEEEDNVYYQTVYAAKEGAVASPTAGLHFTEDLLKEIESSGVAISRITLHVGIATFKPVKSEDITCHDMEEEEYEISFGCLRDIRRAKQKNAKVIAVGTTSLRALESASKIINDCPPAEADYRSMTRLFIYPGYEFKTVDCISTNFHLPKTTLFMLVSAFAGTDLIKRAYQEAVENKYRFYSYGDAMLILSRP
ncbi:MAG: tRNA preQ1(34) S-adenosylmethionine ribosyltransferase-isomerase QueA [Candidatus Omnitrophica bacterium]|nr:tRNA preQ1(34) S-adenosylmethionine ribosyltransferase-isomerase QueA [Candidatus Omnitrophota bacterium]